MGKTMENLHAATDFVGSNYGGGRFKKNFEDWLNQDASNDTSKAKDFVLPSPMWVNFKMPEHSKDIQPAATAESKSDRHALANTNRKKVRAEYAKFIKKARNDE